LAPKILAKNVSQFLFCFIIVFKLACLLLLQGEALFQTHENLEHLAMMERVLGPFPQQMLKRVE
jgi:hypothetical protein